MRASHRPAGLWRRLVAMAVLAAGVALAGCAKKVELMAAIPEAEANEVLGALQNAGIPAEKVPGKEGMVGLHIAGDQVGRAVDLLRAQGLPRERFAGMGQIFKKEGLISSPLEERARYLYALSQELGATLNQIDGVIVARVHVVLPERSSTGEAGQPASAAVFLKYHEGYEMDSVQPLVRRLVTNSIPGLAPEKVTIVMVAGQSPRSQAGPGLGGVGSAAGAAGAAGEGADPGGAPGLLLPAEAKPGLVTATSRGEAAGGGNPGAARLSQVGLAALMGFSLLALLAAAAGLAWRRGWLQRWLPTKAG